jgi:hypothetical protein
MQNAESLGATVLNSWLTHGQIVPVTRIPERFLLRDSSGADSIPVIRSQYRTESHSVMSVQQVGLKPNDEETTKSLRPVGCFTESSREDRFSFPAKYREVKAGCEPTG